ncbi:MAG: hypothetical protein ACLUJV_02415 [Blautia producta]
MELRKRKNEYVFIRGSLGEVFEEVEYRAYIKFQKKDIFLGYFDRIQDAIEARLIAEKEYFGEAVDIGKEKI